MAAWDKWVEERAKEYAALDIDDEWERTRALAAAAPPFHGRIEVAGGVVLFHFYFPDGKPRLEIDGGTLDTLEKDWGTISPVTQWVFERILFDLHRSLHPERPHYNRMVTTEPDGVIVRPSIDQ